MNKLDREARSADCDRLMRDRILRLEGLDRAVEFSLQCGQEKITRDYSVENGRKWWPISVQWMAAGWVGLPPLALLILGSAVFWVSIGFRLPQSK